nr:ribonuclease H-like domain-containing protein [Tanacetum cinerariifolium]
MVPTAALTQSKPISITTVRPVSAAVPKIMVTRPRLAHPIVTKFKSPIRQHGNLQYALKDKGVIDSGCSWHMTGNMSYLSDFKELNGKYVAFGGNPKGGKIYGKGEIKTGKLDFDDVYFVKELQFNIFSVSQRKTNQVGTSQRVDTSDDTVIDDESNQGRMIGKMDKDDAVVLMDEEKEDKMVEEAKVDESAQPVEVQEVVDVVTTAKLITEVVTAASETVTTVSAIISANDPQHPATTITTAPIKVAAAPSRRRKGVVISDPEEESTTSSIISTKTKSKDKGKRIMVEEPKPLKKKQ